MSVKNLKDARKRAFSDSGWLDNTSYQYANGVCRLGGPRPYRCTIGNAFIKSGFQVAWVVLTLVLTCCLCIFPVFPAHGGTLKGKIEASKEFTDFVAKNAEKAYKEKEDYYWLVENGVLPILPPSLDWSAEILIALMKPSGTVGTGGIENVVISGAVLKPSVILVKPKTTVKFKNEDPFLHSIFSPDLGQTFAPEILPSRQTRQVQFLNPGIYRIQCKMTPHLQGYVIVDPEVLKTTSPGGDATFIFENIAPGKYKIKIFYKDCEIGSREIEIVDEKPVEVEMKLTAPKKVGGEKDTEKKKGDKAEKKKSGGKKEKGLEGDSAGDKASKGDKKKKTRGK